MIDMLARTALALLRTYPTSNVFWVAKLAGRTETETTQALVRLEHAELALRENGLWRLTPAGYAACRPRSPLADLRPHVIITRPLTSRRSRSR